MKIKVVDVVVEEMSTDDLKKAKKGLKKSRLYFAPEGEVSEAKRPKVLFRQVFDEVFEKAGIAKPEVVMWDPLAGNAKAPTDPGFVLDGVFNQNIRVTYAAAEAEEPKAEEPAEEVALKSALEKAGGNQTAAAKILSMGRSTLSRRLKKYAINAADFMKKVEIMEKVLEESIA